MHIDVIEVAEQPDGSARVILDLDSSALAMIVEKFVTEALTKEVNAFAKQKEIDLEDAILQEEMEYADDSLSSIVYGNKD